MKQVDGQISIFDWNPQLMVEPDVGETLEECGAVIPHIMVKGYIGRKVLLNTSFPRGYVDREPPHPTMAQLYCFQFEEQSQMKMEEVPEG